MAVRDELAGALDPILVPEAGAAKVGAASPDPEPLVEVGGAVIPDADLGRERLHASVADRLVAACMRGQIGDACDLEPDDEGRVMRDALRIGLGEPDRDVRRER